MSSIEAGIVKPRQNRPIPDEQQHALRQAQGLAWLSLLLLGGVSVMMYAVMGGSQTMKTALVEDLLSLMSPIAFLFAVHFQKGPVREPFINGRARSFDVTFFISAVALTGVGLAIVWDGAHTLLTRTHPVIGTVEVGGTLVWQGWLMIGGLFVSAIPPVILGHLKLRMARKLSLKTLYADADTNKADWMTAFTGIVGVIGIGFGLWWADAVAALLIAISVLKDGIGNLRIAIREMHDTGPVVVEGDAPDPLVRQVRDAVAALDWVARCQVRLHEEGYRVAGLVFVAPRDPADRVTDAEGRQGIVTYWAKSHLND